jgi:acyl-CoA synthetase (AMP-forming)/AMP-acid ligase II
LLPEEHDLTGPRKKLLRSCGKIVPGMQLRVVDSDTGKDVKTGDVGEIWVKGPQVMKGYWNMPEETKKSIDTDGWFRTGDAAYLDEEGYVYIFDRVKDMIVSGGENVYPAEVENALMGHPAIADVAVIGVPDEKWGEVPKALVVRKADTPVTEEEIISFARERLAGFKVPKSVDWIDALPRNPSGKILKKDLRAPYWEGKARQVN